jgi:hypothetical protein
LLSLVHDPTNQPGYLWAMSIVADLVRRYDPDLGTPK